MASFIFIVLSIWPFVSNTIVESKTPLFPAILIFGDSTIDSGNNNYIPTVVKSNYYPYGIDFPDQAHTGRFSNGKLIPDMLASYMGIKELVPPFLDPNLSDDELRTGVCFGSAASGYDEMTIVSTNAILVQKQINNFKKYNRRLETLVGQEEAKKIVNGAMVIVSAGSNDFVLNFYNSPARSLMFNISTYQDFVQNKLQSFIKDLYMLGCRNILVAGLPPIGCLPIQETIAFKDPKNRTCVKKQNSDSELYNQKLKTKLRNLQAQLAGSRINYADVYSPLMELIHNPLKHGIEQTTRGCCGTGKVEVAMLCNPATPTCKKRDKYLFWDSFHPTESAYKHIAQSIFKQLDASISQIEN